MGGDWWEAGIEALLFGLGMSLVMGWLAASRMKARPPAEACKLAHPPSTLISGLVIAGLFLAATIGSGVVGVMASISDQTGIAIGMVPIALLFLGLTLLAAAMIADYFNAWHEVSDTGMAFGSLRGRRDALAWADVTDIRYSNGMKWFRMQTRTGQVARISAFLMGLPEFARLVLAHVPPNAIEAQTLPILRDTAAGKPPSVWN